ncbi:MAG: CdaR family protein [Myxococcota bacterium]|nr:CdaR family protein [Myxococcota bacterium]
MRRYPSVRPGLFLLALAIAVFLWGIASGTSNAERGFDIPVVLDRLPENLVVTEQSIDDINVRVMGSRAVLRNVNPDNYKLEIDVSGAKPGVAVYDVDLSKIDLPRAARFVSHAPSRVQVRFEKRGRKAVRVRADLQGEPAAGFHFVSAAIEPPKVWLVGARSQVMRLDVVITENINLSGLNADYIAEARVNPGLGTVWMEDDRPVEVKIRIEPDAALEATQVPEGADPGSPGGP